jgi:hypothetical protein
MTSGLVAHWINNQAACGFLAERGMLNPYEMAG